MLIYMYYNLYQTAKTGKEIVDIVSGYYQSR